VGGADLIFEEAIDVEGFAAVEAGDAGQGVEWHAEAMQEFGGVEDFLEGGMAALGDAVVIMDFARAIDAQSDQETVFFEKGAPFLVEQGAIGLEIVFDALAGAGVFLLQSEHLAEEIQAHQGGFAALPGEHHFRPGDPGDVLLDEALEDFIGHPAGAGHSGQARLAQVETITAIQIAGATAGFDHGVEAPWSLLGEHARGVVAVDRHRRLAGPAVLVTRRNGA
jgi:hypothetical protein